MQDGDHSSRDREPKGCAVLVVDDDAALRQLVSTALNGEGIPTVTADDGQVALEVAAQHQPFLILLDVNMPVMDGWGFIGAYHQSPEPHAPIVLFTSEPDAGERARAVRVDGLISKPFELDQLVEVVQQYARRHRPANGRGCSG